MQKKPSAYECASLFIQVVAAVAVVFTLVYTAQQAASQADSLRSTAYTAVMDKQQEINKIFIDKPYLQRYFFAGDGLECPFDKDTNKPTSCEAQAVAMADYYLDFFDLFYTQRGSILTVGSTESRGDCEAWERYISDRFENSAVLRERLIDAEKREWYTADFISRMKRHFERLDDQRIEDECGSYGKRNTS